MSSKKGHLLRTILLPIWEWGKNSPLIEKFPFYIAFAYIFEIRLFIMNYDRAWRRLNGAN